MGKVINAICMMSGAYVSGFFSTAPWAAPILAAIGLSEKTVELLGSDLGLSNEFEKAVKGALEKTKKHFRNPEYKIKSLDQLFEEVASPKDLTELLAQMEAQKNKFSAADVEEVVRFFDTALEMETANYAALSRYYLLIGKRLNQEKLEALLELEKQNLQVANKIWEDVKQVSECVQLNSEDLQKLLKRSARAERRWVMLERAVAFGLDILVNAVMIFAVFIVACMISGEPNTVDNYVLIFGFIVLSDLMEHFYYQKYRKQMINAAEINYRLRFENKTKKRHADINCEEMGRSSVANALEASRAIRRGHISSELVEAMIQAMILVAMVLFASNIVDEFDIFLDRWRLLGLVLGVLAKYFIKISHAFVTPSEKLRCERSLRDIIDADECVPKVSDSRE